MSELGTPVTLKLFWDISFLFSVELWLLSSRYWCTTRGLTSIPALLFLPHWFSLQASSSIKRDFSQEGKKVSNNSQKTWKKTNFQKSTIFQILMFTGWGSKNYPFFIILNSKKGGLMDENPFCYIFAYIKFTIMVL